MYVLTCKHGGYLVLEDNLLSDAIRGDSGVSRWTRGSCALDDVNLSISNYFNPLDQCLSGVYPSVYFF